jgi:ribulose-5-phosphate 4-epimerase/fuculose-1-phosphate aldolase
MRAIADRVEKQAAAVIAPWHGLFTLGKTLDAAFDATERINLNAELIMQARQLGGPEMLDRRRAEMIASIAAFK